MPALHEDVAPRDTIDTSEDLDDGRLAGPVLAEKRVKQSGPQPEIDVAQGDGRAKRLAHITKLDKSGALLDAAPFY